MKCMISCIIGTFHSETHTFENHQYASNHGFQPISTLVCMVLALSMTMSSDHMFEFFLILT